VPNDAPRRGSDGKMYPRLRIRKITAIETAFPWRLEQLQAPGPYAHRSLHYEGADAKAAYDKAGEILDNLPKWDSKAHKQAPTVEEIRRIISQRGDSKPTELFSS